MIRHLAAIATLGLASACSPGTEEELEMPETSAEEHYYPFASEANERPNPWIIILPGGGGIEVFGDTEFYFDVARHWNAKGLDALVVHYQEAAPLLGIASEGIPGPMEAEVVRNALAAAELNDWLDLDCPGFVIGFSAGGSGVMSLAADPLPNLVGAIGYYPLVLGQPDPFEAQVPVLVLQGEEDDLTTTDALDAFLASAGPAENFTVHRYPGAEHGFDIPSLREPVEFNGGVFLYEETSAQAAGREADAFVASILETHTCENPAGGE